MMGFLLVFFCWEDEILSSYTLGLPSQKQKWHLKIDGWNTSFLWDGAYFQVQCWFQGM